MYEACSILIKNSCNYNIPSSEVVPAFQELVQHTCSKRCGNFFPAGEKTTINLISLSQTLHVYTLTAFPCTTTRDFSRRYCSRPAPTIRPFGAKTSWIYLPNLLELSFKAVLALPKASSKGFSYIYVCVCVYISYMHGVSCLMCVYKGVGILNDTKFFTRLHFEKRSLAS